MAAWGGSDGKLSYLQRALEINVDTLLPQVYFSHLIGETPRRVFGKLADPDQMQQDMRHLMRVCTVCIKYRNFFKIY